MNKFCKKRGILRKKQSICGKTAKKILPFCGARKPRFGKERKECGNALPETHCFGQVCGAAVGFDGRCEGNETLFNIPAAQMDAL